MRPLYMEPDETLALHALLASTLAPRAVRADPDTLPLRTLLGKVRELADGVYCRGCEKPVGTYANGLCRPCYRKTARLRSA